MYNIVCAQYDVTHASLIMIHKGTMLYKRQFEIISFISLSASSDADQITMEAYK